MLLHEAHPGGVQLAVSNTSKQYAVVVRFPIPDSLRCSRRRPRHRFGTSTTHPPHLLLFVHRELEDFDATVRALAERTPLRVLLVVGRRAVRHRRRAEAEAANSRLE